MPFLSRLKVVEEESHSWELLEDLTYAHPLFDIIVPAGFVTDFASVPRPLWGIFPPFGKYTRAAVVHDYLYRTDGDWSRRLADTIFMDAMRISGVAGWRRRLMWMGVRIFGRPSWYAGGHS